MKKKLLFASAFALVMVGCSQNEFDQLGQAPNEASGISFSASIKQSATTRADLEPIITPEGKQVFRHLWFADHDTIAVLYKKGMGVDTRTTPTSATEIKDGTTVKGWMALAIGTTQARPFAFKATVSGQNGIFVAANDENVLVVNNQLDPTNPPSFRAYWPANGDNLLNDTKVALPALADQTQKSIHGHGIVEKAFMISETKFNGEYDEFDNSVSKKQFLLSFQRVNPIVYFNIKEDITSPATNREYLRDYVTGTTAQFKRFGKLKSVEMEAKGVVITGVATATDISKLTYNSDASWDMAADKLIEGYNAGTTTDAASKIKTTLGTTAGLEWSNDATAFMVVAPVDRADLLPAKKESVTATYTFENVVFDKTIQTQKSWLADSWNGFPSQQGINIDTTEPYIAYAQGTDFVLELNPSFTGKISDIFDGNNLKGFKKATGADIAKTDIKHFVSEANITAAEDFTAIKTLTALTHVTLLANTALPAEAFKGLSNLVYLNLPKVTTVANVDAFPVNDYTEVYMGSYDFADQAGAINKAVRTRLLTAAHLMKADIAAVTGINAGFPENGVTFLNFASLKEITVMPGVVIGGAGFKDCKVLDLVQYPQNVTAGSVALLSGSNSQFLGCEKLTAISLSQAKEDKTFGIPDAAFSGCKTLATINDVKGMPIVPTFIGVESFKGCEALVDINLSQAATIGSAAFSGCTALVGNDTKEAGKVVLYVNAVKHVSDNAFNGCSALKFISFENATTIGDKILTDTDCKEIEFMKAFTATGSFTAKSFGTTTETNTILFCNKAQTGVVVNDITIKGTSTAFKNIDKKYN